MGPTESGQLPSRAQALRNVAEWLKAERLTDRLPALTRQAERLRMHKFAQILADVVSEAGDPLASAAERADENFE
jgi:hypothetical protein